MTVVSIVIGKKVTETLGQVVGLPICPEAGGVTPFSDSSKIVSGHAVGGPGAGVKIRSFITSDRHPLHLS